MNAVGKFFVSFSAAALVSACAVSETRPRLAPIGLIDAGITGNPNVAGIDSPQAERSGALALRDPATDPAWPT